MITPKHIHIGIHTFEVIERMKLHDIDEAGERYMLYGDINHRRLRIRLEQRMAKSKKIVTLWHEALHSVLEQAGFVDHDERLVIALSYGIVQIIQDNPELVSFTKEKDTR